VSYPVKIMSSEPRSKYLEEREIEMQGQVERPRHFKCHMYYAATRDWCFSSLCLILYDTTERL